MKNRNTAIMKQCLVAMGIVINIVGAFVAMGLHLPIYLDSIGTIMIGALLGPVYAIATGILGSLVSGFTFDIYSLYFAPVQICTGLMAGLLFKGHWLKGKRLPLGAFFLSLPTSIASAVISAFVFGGITSSGSSLIVQVLSKAGVNLTISCFIVQIITDYADKFVAVIIVTAVTAAMTDKMKTALCENKAVKH